MIIFVVSGDWVDCQLKVSTGKLIQQQRIPPRVTYCLLTPSNFDHNRVTLLVDSMANRGPTNYRRGAAATGGGGGKKEEPFEEEEGGGGGTGQGDSPTLPDVDRLNQLCFKSKPEDYGSVCGVFIKGNSPMM